MANDDSSQKKNDQHLVEQALIAAGDAPAPIIEAACRLHDAALVTVIPGERTADDQGTALAYQLEKPEEALAAADMQSDHCALTNGLLPGHAAVGLLGTDHPGLLCSHRSCDNDYCPFAIAACFRDLASQGVTSIPLYSRRRDANERVEEFLVKWKNRLDEQNYSMRLLLGKSENDYSGVIIVNNERIADEFLNDLAGVLAALGKIDDGSVRHISMLSLFKEVDAAHGRFLSSGETDLAPRTLHVINRVGDYLAIDALDHPDSRFMLERLAHIKDDHYYLIVGQENEIEQFVDLHPAFSFTFSQHRMMLKDSDINTLYSSYLSDLDETLRNKADDRYKAQFIKFVEFNGDALPFYGEELADYLAKHANATGTLSLPESRYQSSSLQEMLDSIIGLDQVKDMIRRLEHFAVFRKQMKGRGIALPAANMHMLFTGNPGTGKTMVARIITTMLFKIGIIRKNKCVEVSSKDLIAKYVGHTDKTTAKKIEEALGGVLFIDEAYALAPDARYGENTASFGKEAIAEIVKSMEDYKDDLIIIFAGYEREMADFVSLNPGLASRIGYTLHFDDYTPQQLLEIFNMKVGKSKMRVGEGVDIALIDLFTYYSRFPNFGNGRFVDEVLQKALEKHAQRCSEATDIQDVDLLTREDIPSRRDLFNVVEGSGFNAERLLEPLVGLEKIKQKVLDLESDVIYREEARRRGLKLPDASLHMVFLGNPGTGKTTLARIVGKILFGVGAVPNNRFVEVEAKDLVSRYVGDTGEQVTRTVKDALGGILFVDEAYALMETSQAREALAVLVKAMEDHKGEFVAIFAGYRQEMRAFIDANPGLASRIGYTFDFEDYGYDELQQIFERKIAAAGLTLADGAAEKAKDVFKYFHRVENFGNGRFVDRVLQETIALHAKRYDAESLAVITEDDIPDIDYMCKIASAKVFEPSDLSDGNDLLRVAKHEVGHALCRLALTGRIDIVRITMEQEGDGALGYVQHETNKVVLPTNEDLMHELVCLLGGMAAEKIAFGSYSAGNSSDLERATAVASRYVATYGMSEAGLVQYIGPHAGLKDGVASLPEDLRKEMARILDEGFETAQSLLRENREVFDTMVDALLQAKTMTGEELVAVWKRATGAEDAEAGSGDEANAAADEAGQTTTERSDS